VGGMEFYAHSQPQVDECRWHRLTDHLKSVAELAAGFASVFDGGAAARLAGQWHDLGKYSGDFQRMIREANGLSAHIEGEGNERDHTTAGAQHAIDTLGPHAIPVMLAIACHHTGLKDFPDVRRRLKERGSRLLEAVRNQRPPQEVQNANGFELPTGLDPEDRLAFEFFVRMLFSALVDADFLDTEAFYDPGRTDSRGKRPSIPELATKLRVHLEQLEANAPHSEVNLVRRDVRLTCEKRAPEPPGLFTLTVPTGGGKTLAAMAFGLSHARTHGLDRVIVAIPYTSIIEQNASVYREVFGEDAIIEHHSSLDPEKETFRNRIASENWDAPIVVTTTVQLFESLFAVRTSRCRKLHNLANAVIILDEAQSLPGKLLPPILSALAELSRNYHTSTVVCTATQPAFGRSSTLPDGLEGQREICPPELNLFGRLNRVHLHWPSGKEPTPYDNLAKRIASHESCLAIVHLRKDARELCNLVDAELDDESCIHLSALMTPVHRNRTLTEVRRRQKAHEQVRVVSTQLVEAGVDLDFPVVLRALGGLDSLAQAAGRCNREGRLDRGVLEVFVPPTKPPRGVPETALGVATSMLRANPGLDPFAPATQLEYFRRLYEASHLDKGHELQAARRKLQFRTVADDFALIDDAWSAPLVVAHEAEADRRLAALRNEGPSRRTLRALQPYTVNVSRRALTAWVAQGVVLVIHDIVQALEGPLAASYHPRFGLIAEKVGEVDASSLVL